MQRTTGLLRQAAAAARNGSWSLPTIDTQTGIRSVYRAIGPVCVLGPNNFPFAFGSISGGDFAAAVAAGRPAARREVAALEVVEVQHGAVDVGRVDDALHLVLILKRFHDLL